MLSSNGAGRGRRPAPEHIHAGHTYPDAVMDPLPADPGPALDPDTLRGLARLAARADEIDALLNMVTGALERGPQIAETLNDTLHDVRRHAGGDGAAGYAAHLPRLRALATPEAAGRALGAAETVSGLLADPEVQAFLASDLARTIGTLGRLAGRLDELETLLDMVTGAIRRGPEIAETLNDTLNDVRRHAGAGGGPLAAYAPALAELKRLTTPERVEGLLRAGGVFQDAFESEGVQALLNSTVLDPDAVETVGGLATALIAAAEEGPRQQPEVKGPVSLVKALRDPYISRALSFGLGVARAFGRHLEQADRRPGHTVR